MGGCNIPSLHNKIICSEGGNMNYSWYQSQNTDNNLHCKQGKHSFKVRQLEKKFKVKSSNQCNKTQILGFLIFHNGWLQNDITLKFFGLSPAGSRFLVLLLRTQTHSLTIYIPNKRKDGLLKKFSLAWMHNILYYTHKRCGCSSLSSVA